MRHAWTRGEKRSMEHTQVDSKWIYMQHVYVRMHTCIYGHACMYIRSCMTQNTRQTGRQNTEHGWSGLLLSMVVESDDGVGNSDVASDCWITSGEVLLDLVITFCRDTSFKVEHHAWKVHCGSRM